LLTGNFTHVFDGLSQRDSLASLMVYFTTYDSIVTG